MADFFYRYRKNGGEVVGISLSAETWKADDFFGVFKTDEKLDLASAYWSDGLEIRAASEAEIALFAASESEDKLKQNQIAANDSLSATSEKSKTATALLVQAVIVVLLAEINDLRKAAALEPKTLDEIKAAIESELTG